MIRTRMQRWIPLFTCLVLAAAAAGFRVARPGGGDAGTAAAARVGDRVLTPADLERLVEQRIAEGSPASPESRERLRREELRGWVLEEMLFQEGVRAGVDRTDPVVRRRVASVIYENRVMGPVMAAAVDEAELRAFHRERAELFLRPAQVEGWHALLQFPVVVAEQERAGHLVRVARAMDLGAAELDRALREAEAAGAAVRVPAAMDRRQTVLEVEQAFGKEVAAAYFSAEASRRAVTVATQEGVHMVRAVRRVEQATIPFDEAGTRVAEERRRQDGRTRYRVLLAELARRPDVELPPGLLDEIGREEP